jgi:nucleotide-binding universal stress UspA family protein
MKTLMIAIGSHPAASDTLEFGLRLAQQIGYEPLVVHPVERLEQNRTNEIQRIGEQVAGRSIAVELLPGEPHEALAQRAAAEGVFGVVVGRHQSGGARWFGGTDTAVYLALHGTVPLFVVGDEPVDQDRATHPIVVGVDGSASNRPAVHVAHFLARVTDAPLIGLFCAKRVVDASPAGLEFGFEHEHEVRDMIGELRHPDASLVIRDGHPTEQIIHLAEEQRASFVVVGTRSRGGFPDLRAGRVPVQLIDRCPVPLVIVPHDE